MSKIKWKNKVDIDKEERERVEKQNQREKFKNKKFNTLSRPEKDELLLILLEERGLI